MGPLIPLFWTSGDVCPGFQSQGRSLACFLTCVILRITSGVTPADCIEISMTAEIFRSTYLQMCLQALNNFANYKTLSVARFSTRLYSVTEIVQFRPKIE